MIVMTSRATTTVLKAITYKPAFTAGLSAMRNFTATSSGISRSDFVETDWKTWVVYKETVKRMTLNYIERPYPLAVKT